MECVSARTKLLFWVWRTLEVLSFEVSVMLISVGKLSPWQRWSELYLIQDNWFIRCEYRFFNSTILLFSKSPRRHSITVSRFVWSCRVHFLNNFGWKSFDPIVWTTSWYSSMENISPYAGIRVANSSIVIETKRISWNKSPRQLQMVSSVGSSCSVCAFTQLMQAWNDWISEQECSSKFRTLLKKDFSHRKKLFELKIAAVLQSLFNSSRSKTMARHEIRIHEKSFSHQEISMFEPLKIEGFHFGDRSYLILITF